MSNRWSSGRRKRAGDAQTIVTTCDLKQAAGSYAIFIGTVQDVLVEKVVIRLPNVDVSDDATITSISIHTDDETNQSFISSAAGAKANLTAEAQIASDNNGVILKVGSKIKLTIAGGAADAETVCDIAIMYRALTTGGVIDEGSSSSSSESSSSSSDSSSSSSDSSSSSNSSSSSSSQSSSSSSDSSSSSSDSSSSSSESSSSSSSASSSSSSSESSSSSSDSSSSSSESSSSSSESSSSSSSASSSSSSESSSSSSDSSSSSNSSSSSSESSSSSSA